jgi:methyl-accepting chemotaxis protein
MRWFQNLPMQWKLQLGFGAVSVLAATMGILGFLAVTQIQTQVDSMFQRHAIGLAHLKEAQIQALFISRDLRSAILESSPASVDQRIAAIHGYDDVFHKSFSEYLSRVKQKKNKEFAATALAAYDKAWVVRMQTLDLARQDRDGEAIAKLGEAANDVSELEGIMRKLEAEKMDNLTKAAAATLVIETNAKARLVFSCILIVLLSFGIGSVLARMVTGPLREVVQRAEQAAKGDLTVRVAIDSHDELGHMGDALNRMMESFESSLTRVRDAVESTAGAANELAAGSEALSAGAQEQAAALEETAASLEQMTSSVQNNASHAQEANQRAMHSREGAEKGGEVVRQAVVSMTELSQAARKIGEISGTIDEIAFQTNLLALNASVEAARAGEQGRGFAVVAGEVRTLAQRSASASREIRGLIGDSVAKVEASTTLVNLAGETLEGIVTNVRMMAGLVNDISTSSIEQSTGIEEVNKAITQMDAVTQQYASQTEELSATAANLAEHAQAMRGQIGKFQMSKRSLAGARA